MLSEKCNNCKENRPYYCSGYCNPCYQLKRIEYIQSQLPKIKCQCSYKCKIMIPIRNKKGILAKYADHHKPKGIHVSDKRYKIGKYYVIRKPHFKYCQKRGTVLEHRYIMYIYLSILNGKPTYLPKNKDVHHINKNGLDNRIENLKIVTRKQHKSHHKKDLDNRICNICNKKSKRWYNDINGFLCILCYNYILYHKNKLMI